MRRALSIPASHFYSKDLSGKKIAAPEPPAASQQLRELKTIVSVAWFKKDPSIRSCGGSGGKTQPWCATVSKTRRKAVSHGRDDEARGADPRALDEGPAPVSGVFGVA